VIDYKFTMAEHEAATDAQGWAYALVAGEQIAVPEEDVSVRVVFIDAENRSKSVHDFLIDRNFRGLCRTRIEAIHNRRRLFLAGVEGVATPGRHCRFCDRLPRCPSAGAWIFPIVENLTPVGRESSLQDKLRVRPILRSFTEALTTEGKAAILAGKILPGFELEPANGRDKVGALPLFVSAAEQLFRGTDKEERIEQFRAALPAICKPSKGAVVKLAKQIFGGESMEPLLHAFAAVGAIVPGAPYEELVDKTETKTKDEEDA
jgi:hypothetical protein